MNRFALAALAALAACSARAEFVTLAAPATYTPGTPFTVNVGLTPVSNLGLYNVEVVFRAAGASGSWLTIDPPAAVASGYVFPSADNFLGNSLAGGGEYRLTLSDFTLDPTGPDVTAGVNDRIAVVTLRPAPTLTTPIEVSIDRTSLFVDDAAGNSLLGDGPLPVAVVSPVSTEPAPVPAPAGIVLMGIAALVFAVRRHVRSRVVVATPAE